MTDSSLNYIPPDIDRNSVPLWYALYVRSRYEKKVVAQLKERNVECYLPLLSRLRQWKDRKKQVEMVLFPGYVFTHIRLADRMPVLKADGAVWLVGFNGIPAPIPGAQIKAVRRLLEYPTLVEPATYINKGDWVEIIYGTFTGVRGKLIQHRGKRRLVVRIDVIQQALSIEVDISWIKRLEKPAETVFA